MWFSVPRLEASGGKSLEKPPVLGRCRQGLALVHELSSIVQLMDELILVVAFVFHVASPDQFLLVGKYSQVLIHCSGSMSMSLVRSFFSVYSLRMVCTPSEKSAATLIVLFAYHAFLFG